MTLIKKATIRDYYKIKKVLKAFHPGNFNFYSDTPKNLFYILFKSNCFYIMKNNHVQGILFIDNSSKELTYIPVTNKITFFNFLYLLNHYFSVKGFKLNIFYKNLNINIYKKFFSFSIISDLKDMNIKATQFIFDNENTLKNVLVKPLVINQDENIRVFLQNRIFSNTKGRKDLTLEEVINEEKNPKFIKDLCFILEIDQIPSGYGQIFLINNLFYLVNFGIVPEARCNGYGSYFLKKIISSCSDYGIEDLFLAVDNSNISAANLYKKVGFRELKNSLTVEF